MSQQIQLDFQLLPDLNSSPMFCSLGSRIEKPMEDLSEAWSRAAAALRFCVHVAQRNELPEPRATRMREAYLRACLMEYRAIDEVLPRDLKAIGITDPALKIHELKNPLLHIMKELRNLEIHLASSELTAKAISIIAKLQGQEYETDGTVWVTEDLSVAKFQQLRNAKYYSSNDIKTMIDWFNDAQKEWGVNHLGYLAIKALCEELVTRYNLQPQTLHNAPT